MKRTILTAALLSGTIAFPILGTADEKPNKASNASATTASQEQSNKEQDQSTIDADQKKRIDEHITQLSKEVQLTDEQKDRLRTQMSKNADETRGLWQDFVTTQMKVVGLEAHMIAAIEDTLEPDQKTKSKAKREKQSSAQKTSKAQPSNNQSTSDDSKSAKNSTRDASSDAGSNDGDTNSRDSRNNADKNSDNKNNQSKKNRDKNSVQNNSKNKDSRANTENKRSNDDNSDDNAGSSNDRKNGSHTEEVVWTMVIVPVQDSFADLGMTEEQSYQCNAICRSYHKSLTEEWEKLDNIHDQLVAMEAMQIADMEKILTPEQRGKLSSSGKGPQYNNSTKDRNTSSSTNK